MGTKKISKNRDVLKEYTNVVDAIWSKFFIKQGWVDERGYPAKYEIVHGEDNSFIEFADLFIKIDDAILDLEMDCPRGLFEEYYYYSLESSCNGYPYVNYISYIRGFRHKERTPFKEFIYKSKEKISSMWFRVRHYTEMKRITNDFINRLEENECK